MDYIYIEELRVAASIGIYPRERLLPQVIELSLQIGLKTADTDTGRSDNIRDTIDYSAVVERIQIDLAGQHFNLLERLAEYIAQLVIQDFGASWVRVSAAKLGIMRDVRRVGVVIERQAVP